MRLLPLALLLWCSAALAQNVATVPATVFVPPSSSIQAVAGTASAITYTIDGIEQYNTQQLMKQLAQGQIPTTTTSIYSPTTGYTGFISSIHLTNTSGSSVTGVALYLGGSSASNSLFGPVTLPANTTCDYTAGVGWQCLTNGSILTVLSGMNVPTTSLTGTLQAAQEPAHTGDVSNTAGSLTLTLATVNSNVGTYQGLTVNGKGLVTAAANQSYLTGNQTVTLTGDTTGSGATAITTTTGKVNGVAYPAAPSTNTVPVVTGANTVTYGGVPNAALANATAYTVKGNGTASAAAPQDLSSIVLGTPAFSDTGVSMQATTSIAGYFQNVIQNTSNNSAASTDYIVNNNLGTASTYYGDLGINSSTFSGTGSLALPNATYLYSQSGDLVLGTNSSNTVRMLSNNAATDALDITTSNQVSILTSVTVGSGTPVTKIAFYSQTLTPTSVTAGQCAEQTFTVTGLTTADMVSINAAGPIGAATTGLLAPNARVSAANTLAILYCEVKNAISETPTSQTYTILAIRH